MKRLTLLILAIVFFISNHANAQSHKSSRAARNQYTCPKLYLGPSLGIENPAGFIGFNLDVPVVEQFSLGGGFGLSTWGYKAFAEARFYFAQKCNRGWAIGSGVTHNTGLTNFTTTLPTVGFGDQSVNLDLQPKTNIFVAAYHFWNLGHNGHRIYVDLGYSIRLDNDNYVINNGYTLTSDGETVMNVLAPGGLMIGVGFSFGVAK